MLAKGSGRPSCNIAPLRESIRGSNRAEPEKRRSNRVVIHLTPGDPRVDPARNVAPPCRLALSVIPNPRSSLPVAHKIELATLRASSRSPEQLMSSDLMVSLFPPGVAPSSTRAAPAPGCGCSSSARASAPCPLPVGASVDGRLDSAGTSNHGRKLSQPPVVRS
jgi:hypothetical protein